MVRGQDLGGSCAWVVRAWAQVGLGMQPGRPLEMQSFERHDREMLAHGPWSGWFLKSELRAAAKRAMIYAVVHPPNR